MSISRVIEVSFGGGSIAYAKVDTAYFYNNGILFKPTDIDLPASYQVHWADSPQAATTLETIGTAEGAPIPDDLWNRSRVIYGWIYLHPTEDSGVTGYEVRIYKNVRAGLPDGTEPTPAEQSTIDQLISTLNSAVEQTGEDVESASQSAQSAESAKTAAESARDTAGEYANDAESSAASASTSASQASTSATASAQSASQSAQIKADVESLADDAQGYAQESELSATASANFASDSQGYAQSASASAQSASGYASQADISANTASNKASEASTSASTASQKATESAQSATNASQSAQTAEQAKTASQTAQGLAESARDTAVSAKDNAESARDDAESARDEAQQAVASIADALDDKAPVITDTASGAIASFSDGADDLPLKSLIVDINPVQDLHGQDAPYPAGGGVNQCLPASEDDTQSIRGVTCSWDAETETFTFSGTVTDSSSAFIVWNSQRVTGTVFPSTLEADTQYYWCGILPTGCYANFVYLNSSQSPIGSTTFLGNGTFQSIGIKNLNFVSFVRIQIGIYANYASVNGVGKLMFAKAVTAPTAWSPYENICPISGWTQIDVNHSGADMTNPTTLTIQFGQTVYGGKLDVLSGELTVDRAMVDLGTLSWTKESAAGAPSGTFYTDISDKALTSDTTGAICSAYSASKGQPNMYPRDMTFNFLSLHSTRNLYVVDSTHSEDTASTFKAAMSGVQLVYPLATPITIQLTPNQVNSLLGVNNLWADSGDTEVEYRADTKLFIERLTAPDSVDMIADANITSGKYFMVGNSLYKATANIANGSAIIVGTNCTRKSLSEALNEINA